MKLHLLLLFAVFSLAANSAVADPVRFRCGEIFTELPDLTSYQRAAAFLATPRNGSGDVSYAANISPGEFTSLVPFDYGNAVRGTFFTAMFRGEKVFLKSKFREHLSENKRPEGVWFTFLNMLGLGPKFYGVTVIAGKTYLVTEFIEGEPSKFVRDSNPESRLTKSRIDEMKRQLRVLEGFRIFATDVQFIFRKNGEVTIIDPELFTILPKYSEVSLKTLEVQHEYQLMVIKLDWYRAGKLVEQ